MKKSLLLLCILSLMLPKHAIGQIDTVDVFFNKKEIRDNDLRLFDSDTIIHFSLRFDITTFKRLKSDTLEFDAILTYHLSKTDSVNKNIKLRARGVMRRNYCDMPPIRLNFKKSDSPADEFNDIKKIKLVTHCKLGNEDYVLREFLIYKLFNILTENSFRVRLARITYINTKKASKPIEQYGFLIEPAEALCKRIGAVELKTQKVSQRNILPDIMDRMALFNYMIGNTDWSLPIRHNVLILTQPLSAKPNLGIAVPYDFDYSGLVNADYATPFEGLGIKTVRERRYLGICRTKDEYTGALKEFSDKKEEFYRTIKDFPYLKDRSKKDVLNFLDGFYHEIERDYIINNLSRGCIQF